MTNKYSTMVKSCPFCGCDSQTRVFNANDPKQMWLYEIGCCTAWCIGHYAGSWKYPSEQEAIAAWNTRAERTCSNVLQDRPYAKVFFKCSKCGFPKSENIEDQWLSKEVNYCPNCGARVVGD